MTKQDLYDLINYHNKKYWIENNPEISDIEYDRLIKKYLDLGGRYEDFEFESKLNNKKFIHKIPMLSLDKAYTYDEVKKWMDKNKRSNDERFTIEPKFDGWAGKYLIKEKRLVTRGNGYEGEDISDKLPLIELKLNQFNLNQEYILGEIVIHKLIFKKYQNQLTRKTGEPYKTPRTCLTGLLASDTVKNYDFKPLHFIDYSLSSKYILYSEFNQEFFDDIKDKIQNMYPYPCDGLVIKIDDKNYYDSLGNTSHHPRGAIAFKFGNPTGKTKLIDVKWYVGKDFTINPVAIVEPVLINGHTISRVNLHNAENILKLDIKINDTVIIERCGEIIPDIIKVIPGENRKRIIIDKCPSCGSKLTYISPFLYCSNTNCNSALIKRLTDSCTRIGLKNIGPGTIEKMVNELEINHIDDIFYLSKEQIESLSGFAEVSSNNLFNEISNVLDNNIEDWKILSSLNIHGIGIDISKLIMKNFTLEELLNYQDLDYNDFLNIVGLGETRIEDLFNGLENYHDVLKNLICLFDNKIINSKGNDNKELPKICFTGKMSHSRSYYDTLAKENGFDPVSNVNKDLSLLVTTELDRKSSKMNRAKKLGIKIITLQEFEKIITDNKL